MGNCISCNDNLRTVKVIHVDGKVEEYGGRPIRAGQVTVKSPGFYVCSSDAMAVGEEAPEMSDSEHLLPGHIYFLLPVSKKGYRLSLHDLCGLAVTANAAVPGNEKTRSLEGYYAALSCYGSKQSD